MSAAKRDITIEQGATFQITVTVLDSAEVAIDISAYTFRGKIRSNWTSEVIEEFTTTLVDGPAGQFKFALSAAETAAIAVDDPDEGSVKRKLTKYMYDVEIISGSGIVTRVLEGTANVSPEVTY